EPTDVNEANLNDLFLKADGTRWSTPADWKCHRAYLKRIVEKYIHGAKPGRPEKVTGTVSDKQISVTVEHGGKSANFTVSVNIPAGATTPVPAIIALGGVNGLYATTLTEEKVATITYNNTQISDENSG